MINNYDNYNFIIIVGKLEAGQILMFYKGLCYTKEGLVFHSR